MLSVSSDVDCRSMQLKTLRLILEWGSASRPYTIQKLSSRADFMIALLLERFLSTK